MTNPFRWGLLIALVSGCAALSHELLWTRRLIDLLGASNESTARVFGCFFLGLALGSAAVTPFTRSLRRPWRSLGFIELGIGITTLPALTLPTWTHWIWPALGPDRLSSPLGGAVKTALSVLVVLPPAFLMGMSLPVLGCAVLSQDRKLSRQGIWLYAVNTAGGVLGLILTVGWTMRWLGVSGAMRGAVALNFMVAFVCFWLDRTGRVEASVMAPASSRQGRDPRLLAISFLSGAGVLAMEVLILQSIGNVVPSSLYTVSGVLVLVIMLLTVSAAITPSIASRWGPPARLLPWVMALVGVAAASGPHAFVWVTGGMRRLDDTGGVASFLTLIWGVLGVSVGPAILLAGLVLPIAFAWHESNCDDPQARRWGWLLAANGAGGLFGAEFGNLVLMPWLGIHRGMGAVGLAYGIAALWLSRSPAHRDSRAGWIFVCLAGLTTLFVGPVYSSLPLMAEGDGWKILSQHTGPEGVIAVVQETVSPEAQTWKRSIIHNNQFQLGSAGGTHGQRRKMLLPLLLHPGPREVACIGVATGITAGAALDDPNVDSLVGVEISSLVVDAASEFFSDDNRQVCTDPRARIYVEDGRTLIASSTRRYDVIIGDLFRPWNPGVGRLYSVEHFQNVKRALRDGGMFCQWLPMYQLDAIQFETILATFGHVFPRVHMIRGSVRSSIPSVGLIGFHQGDIDWDGLEGRCEQLRRLGNVRDPVLRHSEGVLMHYLGRIEAVSETPVMLNTLNNAVVETAAASSRISTAADDSYLRGASWLRFEQSLARRANLSEEGPDSLAKWQQLGRHFCQLHFAIRAGASDVDEAKAKLDAELPKAMRDDAEADWSAWPIR